MMRKIVLFYTVRVLLEDLLRNIIKSIYIGISFKYHYLRHTYGTRLALLNTPMHILCNQMGHASGNVTQKYYLGFSKQGVELLKSNLDSIE